MTLNDLTLAERDAFEQGQVERTEAQAHLESGGVFTGLLSYAQAEALVTLVTQSSTGGFALPAWRIATRGDYGPDNMNLLAIHAISKLAHQRVEMREMGRKLGGLAG